MNIHELAKLADEWRTLWNKDQWPKGMKRSVEEMNKRKVAYIDYTKHCRNHFMELLEELKRLEVYLYEQGGNTARTRDLIKKAEEV